MVQHSLEESVGEEAATAVEGGEVPNDAAAIAAGCDTLLTAAGLHLDAVHCTLVLLHNNITHSSEHTFPGMSACQLAGGWMGGIEGHGWGGLWVGVGCEVGCGGASCRDEVWKVIVQYGRGGWNLGGAPWGGGGGAGGGRGGNLMGSCARVGR